MRDKSIKVRITAAELEQLNALKDQSRLAAWMRSVCLSQHRRQTKDPITVDPLLLRQLAGIGNNINQISRLMNGGKWSAGDAVNVISVLRSIETELNGIRTNHDSSIQ